MPRNAPHSESPYQPQGTATLRIPSPADQRAIDLVLDVPAQLRPTPGATDGPTVGLGDGSTSIFSSDASAWTGGSAMMSTFVPLAGDGDISPQRLDAVERVLKVLDQCPAMDPPTDLLRRTMHRVEEARDTAGYTAPSLGNAPSAVPNQRPVMNDEAPDV